MRTFLSTHWKSIAALVILVLLAVITMSPGAANADLGARLRQHVAALGTGGGAPAVPVRAARYVESLLADEGYTVRSHDYRAGSAALRHIEASLANVAPGTRPSRIFIIGARYHAGPGASDESGSGTAAVLELARLLKGMRPNPGTELKFVFFVREEPRRSMGESKRERIGGSDPDAGSFIAFVGSRDSSRLVAQALAAFRAAPDHPPGGLAAPAYVQGVTLSDHAAQGHLALMVTDTAFLRYPYYRTAGGTPGQLDYPTLARVVLGLSRTIGALAGAASS